MHNIYSYKCTVDEFNERAQHNLPIFRKDLEEEEEVRRVTRLHMQQSTPMRIDFQRANKYLCPAIGNSTELEVKWTEIGLRVSQRKSVEKFNFTTEKPPEQQQQPQDEFHTYEALCRDDVLVYLRARRIQEDLYCEFDARNDPRLLLSPARVELLCVVPRVELLHEVLSDAEIAHVKRLSRPLVCACASPVMYDVVFVSLERYGGLCD